MKRIFLHSEDKCKSQCAYCFAKWDDLYVPPVNKEIDCEENVLVYYPTCDTDFSLNPNIYKEIISAYNNEKSLIFSFSTKNTISSTDIEKLIDLNNEIRHGFVKVSVSFTTKYRIDEIENNTSSYEERIDLLRTLKQKGIKTSVILKPILPFIDNNEYFEILDDTKFINNYLIGGLYINSNNAFYLNYIQNNYLIANKKVKWCNEAVWKYYEDKEKMNKIMEHIANNGGECFSSDESFLLDVLKEF